MSEKIFIKTGENEALAIDRIVQWKWESKKLTILHEEGTIEIENRAYVEQVHKVLLAKTETFVSKLKRRS
jgi:hypothetical protein